MKKIISLALALTLCAALGMPALAAGFSDVKEDHWARAAIERAAERGITSGYNDGTFRPGEEVTNVQFAVMLSRAFYAGDAEKSRGEGNAWYWANLNALKERNLLASTSLAREADWPSAAGKSITRYDMAQLMANILADKGGAARTGAAQVRITDEDSIPRQYREAVKTVFSLGLITGYADGSFGGEKPMNRAQGCVVIDRLSGCLEEAPETTPAGETDPQPETAPAPEEKGGPTLADGSEMTEENVRRLIEGLKSSYPEGMPWTNDNSHFSEALQITGFGCAGFAFLCSDTAFGDLPAVETHSDFDRVRVGDIIRMNNDTHSVVVLAKNGDSVTLTEGNFNSAIHWGRTVSRDVLERGNFTVTTRWPA